MILAHGCNITKSEKFKGVWILSVPTVNSQLETNMLFWDINSHCVKYTISFVRYSGEKKLFDPLLILYICPLTKEWSVYNFVYLNSERQNNNKTIQKNVFQKKF